MKLETSQLKQDMSNITVLENFRENRQKLQEAYRKFQSQPFRIVFWQEKKRQTEENRQKLQETEKIQSQPSKIVFWEEKKQQAEENCYFQTITDNSLTLEFSSNKILLLHKHAHDAYTTCTAIMIATIHSALYTTKTMFLANWNLDLIFWYLDQVFW